MMENYTNFFKVFTVSKQLHSIEQMFDSVESTILGIKYPFRIYINNHYIHILNENKLKFK